MRLRMLREEVGRLRLRESRRVFDASVHVGELGGPRTGFVVAARDLPVMDVELRVDVVARLLEDTPETWRTAWLVRPGSPEPHDVDLQWFSAARVAFAMHDRPLDGCYVVTRSGWREPGHRRGSHLGAAQAVSGRITPRCARARSCACARGTGSGWSARR